MQKNSTGEDPENTVRKLQKELAALGKAYEALQESALGYRDLLENASDLIQAVTPEGRFLYVNRVWSDTLGYSPEEARDLGLYDVIHPDSLPHCEDLFRRVMAGEKVEKVDVVFVSKKGERIFVEGSINCRFEEGEPVSTRGIFRDITERKRMEMELAKRTRALDMRVKHLRCLYAISQFLEEGQKSLVEILPGIVDLMPPAFQYREITAIRILVDDREYATDGFIVTQWRLAREIMVNGTPKGLLEVCYMEEKPPADEGPFLREERTLLNVICERAGKVIERIHAAEELRRARRREVEIAARIQRTLLLGTPPEDMPGIQFASLAIPSQGVDGDFYDFFTHSRDCVDILIGDVMGKGVRAALLGAGAKSHLFRAMTRLIPSLDHFPEPREIIQQAHEFLVDELIRLEAFITLLYARFDVARRHLDFVDCGHTRTVHFHRATGTCTTLQGQNMPLGFSEKEVYLQERIPFKPGDFFFFYSDAVTEARNDRGELFEEERLVRCVGEHGHLSPRDLINKVLSAVVSFSQSEAFADDLTCIAVKIGEDDGNR
ncbi:MAG: SpoIIE family protein phosphatase [Deltaproteobacteria bacterium]|nr:SpoIIE family protein phosphatase [Deltaproteobacteria bacterium]